VEVSESPKTLEKFPKSETGPTHNQGAKPPGAWPKLALSHAVFKAARPTLSSRAGGRE